jgi:hypothetical protein
MELRVSYSCVRISKVVYITCCISLAALFSLQCDSGTSSTPAKKPDAVNITSPVGGNSFAITDSIPVQWYVNPDTVGRPNLHSFNVFFSLDSGKDLPKITYPASTAVTVDSAYSVKWVIDTTLINPITGVAYTAADFINRGVVIEVHSYPNGEGFFYSKRTGYFSIHQ